MKISNVDIDVIEDKFDMDWLNKSVDIIGCGNIVSFGLLGLMFSVLLLTL